MRLSTAVQQFVQELRVEGRVTTAAAYQSDFKLLVALAQPDAARALNTDLVQRYLEQCRAQGLKANSLVRRAAAVKSLGKWGVKRGVWAQDPTAGMVKPKREETLPKPFTDEEVAALMALPLTGDQRVFRELLFWTGQRSGALLKIKLGDITLTDPGEIRVLIKGSRVQVVALAPQLRTVLIEVVKARAQRPQDPLMMSPRGGFYNSCTAFRWVRDWGTAVGVAQAHPHRFRHTAATDMLERGEDITVIQQVLGHKRLETTQKYAKVRPKLVRAAVANRTYSYSGAVPLPEGGQG